VDRKDATSAVRDLGSFIREQRTAARLSLRNLAKLAGVSNPYLSQIERGLRKPSADILQAIASALRISAETLYVHAGILEERNEDDLAARILEDRYITQRQRRALLDVYLAFRQETAEQRAAQDTFGLGSLQPARSRKESRNAHRDRQESSPRHQAPGPGHAQPGRADRPHGAEPGR
jgi:transcriptional regulator with XRE-family HTH domain